MLPSVITGEAFEKMVVGNNKQLLSYGALTHTLRWMGSDGLRC